MRSKITSVSPRAAKDTYIKYQKGRVTLKWLAYSDDMIWDLIAFCNQPKRLSTIKPYDVTRWLKHRQEDTSSSTARRNFAIIHKWFGWCVRNGFLESNPSDMVERVPAPPKGEIRFLSRDEAARLIGECSPPLEDMVVIAIYAGLRLGEILRLTWGDVDWSSNGGVLKVAPGKTRRPRRVPIHEKVSEVLRREKSSPGASQPVVVGPGGTPIIDDSARRSIRRASKRAGLEPPATFNVLRHTFASWLVQAGVPIYTVSKLLGHSSVTTTEMYYAALQPEEHGADLAVL